VEILKLWLVDLLLRLTQRLMKPWTSSGSHGQSSLLNDPLRKEMALSLENLAVKVVNIVKEMPRDSLAELLGKQLVRAATTAGATFCRVSRASCPQQLLPALAEVQTCLEETLYWANLLTRCGLLETRIAEDLRPEIDALGATLRNICQTA